MPGYSELIICCGRATPDIAESGGSLQNGLHEAQLLRLVCRYVPVRRSSLYLIKCDTGTENQIFKSFVLDRYGALDLV
jgi:hypothetical protein